MKGQPVPRNLPATNESSIRLQIQKLIQLCLERVPVLPLMIMNLTRQSVQFLSQHRRWHFAEHVEI